MEEQIEQRPDLEHALSNLINSYSQENLSNTPDFILAQYLLDALDAFNKATNSRNKWYGYDKTEWSSDRINTIKEVFPLQEEIAFYEENLDEWLEHYYGLIVLVKGRKLINVFKNQEDALLSAAKQFGIGPYLIRQVLKEQPIISIPTVFLGSNAIKS